MRAYLPLQFFLDLAEGLLRVERHVDGPVGAREVVLQEEPDSQHFEEAVDGALLRGDGADEVLDCAYV